MYNAFDTIKLEIPRSEVKLTKGFFSWNQCRQKWVLRNPSPVPGLSQVTVSKLKDKNGTFVLTISSKILGEDCLLLIDQDSILQVYEQLMNLGYFHFSLETFLSGKICIIHPCRDVPCEDISETILALARYNSKSFRAGKVWSKQRSAKKSGITFHKNDATSPGTKTELTFYDKGHELGLRKNRELFGAMARSSAYDLLSTAKNKLRVEMSLNTHEQIRRRLKIKDVTLRNALNSEVNVLYHLLNDIIKAKPKANVGSKVNDLSEYMRRIVLIHHQNCLESLRADIKAIVGSHNLGEKMKPYEKLHAQITESDQGAGLVESLLQGLAN